MFSIAAVRLGIVATDMGVLAIFFDCTATGVADIPAKLLFAATGMGNVATGMGNVATGLGNAATGMGNAATGVFCAAVMVPLTEVFVLLTAVFFVVFIRSLRIVRTSHWGSWK